MSAGEPKGCALRVSLVRAENILRRGNMIANETERSEFEQELDEIEREFGSTIESGGRQMQEELREHTDTSPVLAGGDIDAAWQDDAVGDELVGGENPTPDQDMVDELGKAVGVTFQDNEPLDLIEKVEKRDRNRWELDPASAEQFEP